MKLPLVLFLVTLPSLLSGCGEGDPATTSTTDGPGLGGSTGQGGGQAGSPGQGGSAATGGQAGAAGSGGAQAGAGATGASFVGEVVSFEPGKGAGFGQEAMPGVVYGPPVGGVEGQGSLDVVSLGAGGVITLRLGSDVIDGPGADFIVFENPFVVGGNPDNIWKELGEVSVSVDGATWATFPCAPEQLATSHCAGWRPVKSSPQNGIPPTDPDKAGGDPFDLAVVGLERARFVRIRDLASAPPGPPTAGFDLDAVVVVHGAP